MDKIDKIDKIDNVTDFTFNKNYIVKSIFSLHIT
jgi:hypothetical protein